MIFLEPAEVRALTGKAQKTKQVEQLRKMGIPFFVNAAGHPIVARAAVEGSRQVGEKDTRPWRSAALGT
jgi:hypothetical protein